MKSSSHSVIRLLVLDVDGVLTDGRLHYGARGEALKVFHVRDGQGIKALQASGVTVAVISGRRSAATLRRCRELDIRHVFQSIDNKLACLEKICKRLRIALAECAAVGDDTADVAVLRAVGRSFAPADAHRDAHAAAQQITRLRGGHGAVREVCDALLASRAAARIPAPAARRAR